MGDSLQEILLSEDKGKELRCISPATADNTKDIWKKQIIRIYFQNVNGLSLKNGAGDVIDAFVHMKDIGADIFGFVETKLNCIDPNIQSKLQQLKTSIWERHDTTSKLVTCSSEMPWDSSFKPGGVALGFSGPLVGRQQKHYKDKYGRWVRCDLLGRDGRTISIICAYQVTQELGEHGMSTAYSQQIQMMRLDGVQTPNPRASFIQDLLSIVHTLRQHKHDMIIMGDFNEAIGEKPEMMAKVILAGDLVDVFNYRHGLDREQSTYARGKRRVDYILVSNRLATHLVRTGAEPFNFRVFSDHRGLFADFSYAGFFDRSPNVLVRPPSRDLIYDAPRHVKLYLQATAKYFQAHNMRMRLQELLEGKRDDEAAEALDRDITSAMLSAENSLKTTNRAPWSKELHQALTLSHIMRRLLSQFKTRIDMSDAIMKLQAKLFDPITLPVTQQETNMKLRELQREIRKIMNQAAENRKTREREKIQARQLANPSTAPEQIARQLKQQTAMKELYKRVPSTKPFGSCGISMIQVPDPPTASPTSPSTTFRSVVDPVEIETLILERNRKHFGQASNTPLAQPTVLRELGYTGTSKRAKRILQGKDKLDDLTKNHYSCTLLRNCKRTIRRHKPTISLKDFKSAYRRWRVTTSTSPSGRHLSHQHLLLQPHGIKAIEVEENREAEQSREDNWKLQHGIIRYAIKHGYCFRRWQQVVNTMIEKEPGNPKLHRLRVIHLYESDYNLLLGAKLREMMHHLEDKRLLNIGTYGSRANRQALDPVFIEVLQYDYASLTRFPEIKFGNDTSSCYDRQIAAINNLVCMSYGLSPTIAKIHGSMLKHCEYRIKTQLGVSEGLYSHSPKSPIFGTGQGSKGSPTFWATLCSKLFDIYDKKCNGAFYRNPANTRNLKLGMTGFVDDNACNVNSLPEDRHQLVRRAQEDCQLWNDILFGGSQILEPPKCSYHFLETAFTSCGAPVFKAGQHGERITIADPFGNTTILTQIGAFATYKTLGTMQSPTTTQKTQFQKLKDRSKILLRQLALSSCSGHASWLYYKSKYLGSMGYPLAVSRLTNDQLHQLQGPMLSVILNRMGYNKRTARALIFGPRSHGGLEIDNLQTMQGIAKLNLLIRHLRTPGQPNTLALIIIDLFQYVAGVAYPILQLPGTHLPHLEGIWIPTIREYLAKIRGSLRIAGLCMFRTERESDEFIMDVTLDADIFTDSEVKKVNYCRLYLQVMTISDICNAAGTHLAEGIRHGKFHPSQSRSAIKDCYQERPDEPTWAIWRRMLAIICDKDDKLYLPMGRWVSGLPTRRIWPNLWSQSRQRLFQKDTDQEYSEHRQVRHLVFSVDSATRVSELPQDIIPVDTTKITDGLRINFKLSGFLPPKTDSSGDVQTLREYFDSLPLHESLLLRNFDIMVDTCFDVCDSIESLDDIILVSDGGALESYGAFGWVLGTVDGTRLATGHGSVFGLDPSSFRAEGYGAKAGTLFLYHVFLYCERIMPQGTYTFSCDNLGLLQKLESFREYQLAAESSCMHPEWDMVNAIHLLQQKFPVLPLLIHVKGHQDRNTPFDELPISAQMNVEADSLASRALQEYGSPQKMVPFDDTCKVLLDIKGVTVTTNITQAIRRSEHLSDLMKYYRQRFMWSLDVKDSIDWRLFAMSSSKNSRTRTFCWKFGWKKLGVGSRLYAYSPSYDHRCPTCLQDNELDDHVFQCHSIQRADWRADLLLQVKDLLTTFLDPNLLDILHYGLTTFLNNTPPDWASRFPYDKSTKAYAELIQTQTSIGWDHFFRGKWSQDWVAIQYFYAKRFNCLKESEGWAIKLIRLFATSAFDAWEDRNKRRHGHDSATRKQKAIEQAHREIRNLYSLSTQVLAQDQSLFRPTLSIHLSEPLHRLQSWITANKALILHSAKQAKEKSIVGTQHLKVFFPLNSIKTSKISLTRKLRKPKLRNSHLTRHFEITGHIRSTLPPTPEEPTQPDHAISTQSRWRQSPRTYQQMFLSCMFPDHPT